MSVILARADAADAELVADFAANFGLRVTESSPEKRTVKLSGSAADFDRAFQTQLAHFGDYVTYQGPLSVPDKLDGKILAVLGLDNRPVAHPH